MKDFSQNSKKVKNDQKNKCLFILFLFINKPPLFGGSVFLIGFHTKQGYQKSDKG